MNHGCLGTREPADLQAEGAGAHAAAGAGRQGALTRAQPGGDAAEVGAVGAMGETGWGRRWEDMEGANHAAGGRSFGAKSTPSLRLSVPTGASGSWHHCHCVCLSSSLCSAAPLSPCTLSPSSPLSPCALPRPAGHLAHWPPPLGLGQMALPLAACPDPAPARLPHLCLQHLSVPGRQAP